MSALYASEAVATEAVRWNAFVASSPERSFLQTWQWGMLQGKMNVPHWHIIIEDNGVIVAVALVLERSLQLKYSWLYIPRGPIFAPGISSEQRQVAWEVLEEKVRHLAEERDAFFVRVDPLLPTLSRSNWRKASREVQPQHTLLLNLSSSEEELLAQMHSKTRYNVNLAQRKGVDVRFSNHSEDIQEFIALSQDVTSRTGFSYHSDDYYAALMEVLGAEGMAELAVATVEGETVAAHLMVYSDGIATYAHGASKNDKREFMAPALLYWKTILRAKEKGMHQYDFFGVAPEDAPEDHSWAGITRMKLGFGGSRVSYCGAYDLVLHEGLYAGFSLMRGAVGAIRKARASFLKGI